MIHLYLIKQKLEKDLRILNYDKTLYSDTMVPSFLGDVEMALTTESLIAGSPAQVAEYFSRLEAESTLEHVTICPAFGNVSAQEAQATLAAFVENVIAV